jgi:hypothetical protein
MLNLLPTYNKSVFNASDVYCPFSTTYHILVPIAMTSNSSGNQELSQAIAFGYSMSNQEDLIQIAYNQAFGTSNIGTLG